MNQTHSPKAVLELPAVAVPKLPMVAVPKLLAVAVSKFPVAKLPLRFQNWPAEAVPPSNQWAHVPQFRTSVTLADAQYGQGQVQVSA
jgi:hypothetical protein